MEHAEECINYWKISESELKGQIKRPKRIVKKIIVQEETKVEEAKAEEEPEDPYGILNEGLLDITATVTPISNVTPIPTTTTPLSLARPKAQYFITKNVHLQAKAPIIKEINLFWRSMLHDKFN